MQVRAHHQAYFLGPRTGSGQPLEVVDVEHVPERPARLDLVVAAAGVDQDLLAADLQQPAMHAELDLSGIGVVVVRRQPMLVLGQMRIAEVRKNVPQHIVRNVGFLDARDGGLADFEHWRLLCRYFFKIYFGRNSLVKVDGKSTCAGPCRLQIGEGRARLRFGHVPVFGPDLADGVISSDRWFPAPCSDIPWPSAPCRASGRISEFSAPR